MCKCPRKLIGWWLCCAALLFAMPAGGLLRAQGIDSNHNGISDIWELLYGATGVDPNADPDADTVPNRLESIAGTNPFDSNSVPRIASSVYTGGNFSVSLPCVLGKSYQLQSSRTPAGINWSNETSIIARTGVVVTLNAPTDAAGKFFRVVISDVDSDGDGLTDWEEMQLGLDPTKPFSNGQFDASGQPMGDFRYVTNRLASQNVITITASNPSATVPDSDPATDTGMFTLTRGGFPLNSVTVQLGVTGTAAESADYAPLPRPIVFPAGVNTINTSVTPLASSSLKGGQSVTMFIQPGAGYIVGAQSTASVIIFPSATPTGTGLTGKYYNGSSTTYNSPNNFNPANLRLTRVDPVLDIKYGAGSPDPSVNADNFSVRWTGQVMPQYSEPYTFFVFSDEGVKLWVDGQLIIDKWVIQPGATNSGTINLQAGVRYNIQLDYFEATGGAGIHFSWDSPSQPWQIIPQNRLYPTTSPAPAAVINSASTIAFVNQPFSYAVSGAVSGSNGPTQYGASPLPPGLTFTNTSTNGWLSGIPLVAGQYQIVITATNAAGVGASMLNLLVIDTGNGISREVWSGVPGSTVSSIPLNTPPTSTDMLTNLAGPTDFGDDYGDRVRGYLTAPVTGNYYFWISASDSAELWISNNGEPVNKVKRASVLNGTPSLSWANEPNQQSPWLALVAGQRYYIEVLHKAGTGPGDNVAVGWSRPGQTGTGPSEIVPGFVLSPYVVPSSAANSGTLYAATLLPEAGAISKGVGTATLRLSADETQATLRFSYTNLTSPVTQKHIHADPYLAHPSQIIFDLDTPPAGSGLQADGSYLWQIQGNGGLTTADLIEIIKEGKAYLNIHTVNYGNGEIRGNFVLANGSSSFDPPPPAPSCPTCLTDLSGSAVSRFLAQSTFGASPSDIVAVQTLGYEGWINDQFTNQPISYHLPNVLANPSTDPNNLYTDTNTFNTWWQQSITAPDQLRQRVAFALSEILVVSDVGTLNDNARALSDYYDTLLDGAFGNFRTLLETVTLTPAMGLYLDMRGNDRGDQFTGRHPNENYAREIMQLFSIGLNRMWPDGTLVLDSQGNIVPTYDQNVIMGYAAVFTGWNYHQANQGSGRLPVNFTTVRADYINPMTLVPTHHDVGAKRVLDNIVLPPATGNQADPTSPEFDAYGLQEFESALDAIFNNQNVGPFICRQLIQRLVTSHPSRDYLYRVVQAFNDNGAGVRGDLQAVIKAILLDYEARSIVVARQPEFGKQREPLLRVTAAARAFPPPAATSAVYAQTGGVRLVITAPAPHRLANGDNIVLQFTSGAPVPGNGNYTVGNATSNTFTVVPAGLLSGSYTQALNITTVTNVFTDTNGVLVTNLVSATNGGIITVNLDRHGLSASNQLYLTFFSGGAQSGLYQVFTTPDGAHFTVTNSDATLRGGIYILADLSAGYTQTTTNVTFSTIGSHNLNVGDPVYIAFPGGAVPDGAFQVAAVADATHFTVFTPVSSSQANTMAIVLPLLPPTLVRSGNVTLQFNTWNIGDSDTDLTQTPLNSPTVFNYFFPDYKFPGLLASAGLTTPEFQLTSDTGVARQMNFLYNGIVPSTDVNGFTGFRSGNGSIMLDLSSWMSTAYTSDANLPGLVDALNSLLVGGQLSSTVKNFIVTYAKTLPYSTPTTAQMRDRVRAVVHMIITSPDFTIQK